MFVIFDKPNSKLSTSNHIFF